MEATVCNFSEVIANRQSVVRKINNIPDTGFEEVDKGNFNFIGIRAHSGFRGDKDDLLILNPSVSQEINDFGACIKILYELGKVYGRSFVSWQEVLIDADHYQNGKLLVLQRHFSPCIWDNHQNSWQGEVILCTPNDKLIQYAVERESESQKRRNRWK